MTDDNATKIVCAFMLSLGLLMNGCQPRSSINEYALIDEQVLADGLAKSACYMSGRNWEFGSCKDAK